VSQAINRFCIESNAKVNYQKSSFLRVNKCKLGLQLMREDRQFIYFFFFCRRNLNLVQKVMVSNTFIFAKLVHQPNYASRKPPLGEDKKGYWNFFMVWIPV
jgi:hypothetical protein